MTFVEMQEKLKKSLKKERYEHSLRVYETAVKMAEQYKLPKEKISIAALLHDCGRVVSTGESVAKAKELNIKFDEIEKNQPILLHQKLGVYYAYKDYGIMDAEILDAIGRHTTGGKNMSEVAKIVFVADMIEQGRNFLGVEELRQAAKENLDKAMKMCYAHTIKYLLNSGLLIHPDCIDGYNELVSKES